MTSHDSIVVFASGRCAFTREQFDEVYPQKSFIICADGGALHAIRYLVDPHVVVGDFDSLSTEMQERVEKSGGTLIRHPRDKDETDLELALMYALTFSPKKITIFGGLGGRIDHELGNILLAADKTFAGIDIIFEDHTCTGYLLRNKITQSFQGINGQTFSLIPLSEKVTGVTMRNARWELKNAELFHGKSRSLCNEFLDGEVELSIQEGILLVITLKP